MRNLLPALNTIFSENHPCAWPRYLTKGVVWQVRKWLGHNFTTRLGNGAVVKVYPSTAYSAIFYASHPEGGDLAFIRKHAQLSDNFIDVGANVGLFSASLFDCFKRFICFEPSPSSSRALSETCDLNPAVQCELHNIGVGDQSGELFFEDRFDFSTGSCFVQEASEKTTPVFVDTLDRMLFDRFDAMVMKIDVEGFEEKVFIGAD